MEVLSQWSLYKPWYSLARRLWAINIGRLANFMRSFLWIQIENALTFSVFFSARKAKSISFWRVFKASLWGISWKIFARQSLHHFIGFWSYNQLCEFDCSRSISARPRIRGVEQTVAMATDCNTFYYTAVRFLILCRNGMRTVFENSHRIWNVSRN